MLNEWSDRDPDPEPPRRISIIVAVVIAGLVAWGTVQAIWTLIAG